MSGPDVTPKTESRARDGWSPARRAAQRSTPETDEEMAARFWAKVQVLGRAQCWEWSGGKSGDGYAMFTAWGRYSSASRVAVYLATGERVPAGLFVLHSCDNPACVNPAHLRVGDQVANMADMHGRGRAADVRGAKHPQAILTPEAVAEIRATVGQTKRLAAKYGVATPTIVSVRSGQRWRE